MKFKSFNEVVIAAIKDLSEFGFDSLHRVERWQRELTYMAERESKSDVDIDARLKDHLGRVYAQQVTNKGIMRRHKIQAWTLEKVKPKLRNELDRRIMASAQLIKLNRQQAITKTLQRFSGWSTSLPTGGSEAVDKRDVAEDIKKSIKQLPYEERRVLIDQSHKLKASLDDIIASDNGAIAAVWHSRHSAGYDNRPEHLKRDGKVYFIRDNWALSKGYAKLAGHQYTDEITQPAEEIYCSCNYVYLYGIRDLPQECITIAGRELMAKS